MGEIGSDLGFVLNQTTTPTQPMQGLQEATVISADPSGVRVKIPAFHPDWAFGPARYSWPDVGLPPVDTACLVAFTGDDLTRPWIVTWGAAPTPQGQPIGLPGATAPTRYVGATTSGAPTTGTFAKGDLVVDQTGATWVCTTAGTPGVWRADYQGAGLAGATAASRYAGATASGAPTTGTFAKGDYVIAQDGITWICTVGGSPGTWTQSYWAGAGLPVALTGAPGATGAARFVGGTPTGAPAAGTFAVGDFVVAQDGQVWTCITAGTPGVWRAGSDRPTGTIEPTFLTAPAPNTLILNGQTVSRTTYARLWSWVQANARVQPGLFTNGDGATTFGLPNLSGRSLVALGSNGTDTYTMGQTVGAARVTLTTANLAAHSHPNTISVDDHGTHQHDHTSAHTHTFTTASGGDHNHSMANPKYLGGAVAHNHAAGPGTVSEGASPNDGAAAAIFTNNNGGHGHTGTTDLDSNYTHTLSGVGAHNPAIANANAGSGTPVDARPPLLALNYVVWT